MEEQPVALAIITRSPNSWVTSLRYGVSPQPELARALATEANHQALERFHPAVIARRHLEIYCEVLGLSRS